MYNGSFVVFDVVKGQWGTVRREKKIRQVAILDGRKPTIWMEQEPGSAGKDSVTFSIKGLAGYKAKPDKVTGNKETRAIPYADQVNIGNVFLVKAPWNKDFIEEHATAPSGAFKDQWDAAAGAFNRLTVGSKKAGALRK
jgi:predicted phage terminase large subunit-like protein